MIDFEKLLAPIAEDSPTGEDLRYVDGDLTFQQIEENHAEEDPALVVEGAPRRPTGRRWSAAARRRSRPRARTCSWRPGWPRGWPTPRLPGRPRRAAAGHADDRELLGPAPPGLRGRRDRARHPRQAPLLARLAPVLPARGEADPDRNAGRRAPPLLGRLRDVRAGRRGADQVRPGLSSRS